MRLRLSQYLGYAGGEVANNLAFSMVSSFVLIYYADVAGIAAGAAGMLFLVVRIWGGVTDLVADRRVDETSTRWAASAPTCCSARSRLWRCSSRCSRSLAG